MLLKFLSESKYKVLIIVASVLLLIIAAVSIRIVIILNRDTFYDGVAIEGIDVSGLSIEQARELVEERLTKIVYGNSLLLNHEEMSWKIRLSDISYSFLVDEAIERAYSIGREGSVLKRLGTIRDLKSNKKNVLAEIVFSKSRLEEYITSIKKQVDENEKNATVTYKNGNIIFDKENIGRFMDVDKNVNLLENRLLRRDFSSVELEVKKVYPKIMYKDISHIEEVISSFSTVFNSSNVNRSHNIRLACERINNKILLPGEVFSMDASLGTRTKENGYKDAPVIVKGRLIEGVGGGVCQVTTTLYVAVLKAKLDVVERVKHSMPLGYVEPGQDATISEGYIDFKFKNSSDRACLISASVVGNKIIIKLIGAKSISNHDVRLKSVVKERMSPPADEIIVDNELPAGTVEIERESVQGLKVEVYRETYENNKLIESEKISEDIYKPIQGRKRIGPSDKSNTEGRD
ncbi:VanW family protein [Acetivibrio mesophilus]|uniref:Vanomycin resistance protein VanB n=1 Tax=Acetivibrio mesophilus TaxID=2487273 RepID=A0A4Q0I7G4_9FIRM|nr:VanW family protein [Acetivibrio mesophilus]ODM25099.1 vanomycin resistance protein VanB [Clostridium sp. Bc-iso-3]RXE59897.1 vanomycin resistance protein VanB [Acetivibrio mesophilus]HHV29672.1 vanomycin resistance protein VanB [Clostridium sp.]